MSVVWLFLAPAVPFAFAVLTVWSYVILSRPLGEESPASDVPVLSEAVERVT